MPILAAPPTFGLSFGPGLKETNRVISFDPQYTLDLARSRMLHRVTPMDVTAAFAAPYSGATLFAILLARHPDVSSDGETFPWVTDKPVLCSCGKPQIDCPYYREAASHFLSPDGRNWNDRLFTAHPHYSRLELLDKGIGRQWQQGFLRALQHCLRSAVPGWRRLDRDFVNAHLQFVENSLRLRHARVYVDGTKSIRRAVLFAESGRVRLKAIHLVRDGRGFCFSYLKNNKLPRTRLALAARKWLGSLRAVDRFRARMPHIPMLSIRYEDLCHDVPATLQRVCDFLDLPYDPALERTEPGNGHLLGNRMRLTFDGRVEQCVGWQHEFTGAEIAFLDRELRSGLEAYQYPLPLHACRPLTACNHDMILKPAGQIE
jgi:hypothetical protein